MVRSPMRARLLGTYCPSVPHPRAAAALGARQRASATPDPTAAAALEHADTLNLVALRGGVRRAGSDEQETHCGDRPD
jgi:hypothetical protein